MTKLYNLIGFVYSFKSKEGSRSMALYTIAQKNSITLPLHVIMTIN